MKKLFDLTNELNDSASNEGCDAELMVVGAKQLWNLLQHVKQLKAASESLNATEQTGVASICDRLLDSEEHAGESAIPAVAEEAAEEITRLAKALTATQVALSQAMAHSEKTGKLVVQVAGLSIWDYDKNDGTPYEECDEPGDGHLDSHCCLMSTIEDAREILASQ